MEQTETNLFNDSNGDRSRDTDRKPARFEKHASGRLNDRGPDSTAIASTDLVHLSETERQKILVDWNRTEVDYPQERLVHEWFEARVKECPDAPAVTFAGHHLTYRELNRRANQLAHYLRRAGVGPDVLVGLFLERSLEMVVGLLGILKAGGAYVPIDPEYPRERVAFLLEDSGVAVLLTEEGLRGLLPSYSGRILCLDGGWASLSGEEISNPPGAAAPHHLAYVIYTSGSTGTPKGAMNSHRGVCNRLLWAQDQYRLTEADVILQKTPFSFDVSVWEFFWPLLAGARMVLAKPGGHRDPAYLVKLMVEERITVCHFVPAMLGVFLAHPGVQSCRSLRHVICSGEALSYRLQEQFFSLLPAQLHNLYGPTEAAVDVTHWTCERNSKLNIVPIGRPVANTRAYILDSNLCPLPIGEPGELYIGGVQVGRGYHKRPDLTAERFIRDPFQSDAEARLYKTGDLCRWLPDGNLEYLGRLDFQVKIQGNRIELGEIEAALCRHPAVATAVVVARDDGASGKYLAGFIVGSQAGSATAEELREFLKQKLPAYMLPARFVFIEQLPLLPNGKVNRKALTIPATPGRTYVPPSDPTERRLIRIWESLLGLHSVGIQDDFFELGGQSILAVQLLAEIERDFEIQLAMPAIFQAPTVEALARLIRNRRQPGLQLVPPDNSARASSLVPIQPAGSKPPVFCISGVGGGVFVFRILARHLGADQPIYGLQPPEPDGKHSALLTVPDIAEHYIHEMRAVQPQGPYFLAGFSFGGMVAFEMASQLRRQGHSIGLLLMLDSDLSHDTNEQSVSARAQNRWNVYRTHFSRVIFGPNRAAYLKGTIRARAKLIYKIYAVLGRPVPPSVLSLGTVLDIQTFAGNNYIPGNYYDRVTLFRCRVRPASETFGYDLGWGNAARGGLDVYDVPGDHHSMWTEPHVRTLVSKLRTCLEHAREASGDERHSLAAKAVAAQ